MKPNYGRYKLLAVNADAKTSKGNGDATGYLTAILYLSPADTSGIADLCQFATAGCKASCLNTAGRGRTPGVQRGRLRKTRLFFGDRQQFFNDLADDIARLQRYAARYGLQPVVRLNGTSDMPWHRIRFFTESRNGFFVNIMAAFPDVIFYDYTKDPGRMVQYLLGRLPKNYDLTFSRSETNWPQCSQILHMGGRVAVVFGAGIPGAWRGWPVINGDGNDLRHTDPGASIVGLKAKGKAKKDRSGFVVRN